MRWFMDFPSIDETIKTIVLKTPPNTPKLIDIALSLVYITLLVLPRGLSRLRVLAVLRRGLK
jgi:hypothetical protein